MAELHGLIRLTKGSVDDRQRALADLLRQAEELARQCQRINDDLARERGIADKSVHGESLHFGRYVAIAVAKRRDLEAAASALDDAIAAARDVLAEEFRQLRALELAEEARLRHRAEIRARREQDALDELGLQRHQRAVQDKQTPICQEKGR